MLTSGHPYTRNELNFMRATEEAPYMQFFKPQLQRHYMEVLSLKFGNFPNVETEIFFSISAHLMHHVR